MTQPVQDARRLGQSIWYDNIRRGLITSGELQRLVDLGVTGLTSNPTIFEKAIAGSTDYDDAFLPLARDGKDAMSIYEALAIEDIRSVADLLRPVYDRTGGADGYASLEVNPALAHETEQTVSEARRLFAALDRTNVLVKVPATPEGIPAIRRLIGEGINVNVTLIFSLDAYRQVMEAYISGLETLVGRGGDLSRVASVASFFVSRVDTAVDRALEERIRAGDENLKGLEGKAAVANAKLAYQEFKQTFGGRRFASLRERGARVQRPLWASTGTKNPTYSDVLYVEPLIGPDTVNTMPEATLNAFLEHGAAEVTIEQGVDDARRTMEALEQAGVDMAAVTDQLLADGVKAFADSFDKLITNIEEKRARLLAGEHKHPGVSLGESLADVERAVASLQSTDVVKRIWQHDHTVWKPEPDEITNRLGWLTVTDTMCEELPALEAFAREIRDAGYRHLVLLGMGGSSLGPEALRRTFGSAAGYPELIVLDSTVPGSVRAVAGAIEPARTLFLVSSKSGTTLEPLVFYRYFRDLVEQSVGTKEAGRSFVAITDPGTHLEDLARQEGFRRAFINPPDIGGRYSVLSYFGLVPAALMGLDVDELIERADRMREGCHWCVPTHDNPGAWLGSVMGTLASNGRDKLTLVTSPSIGSFGLWAEQLLAESTGKEGKGIVPIAEEPVLEPGAYGRDRVFVYMRVDTDDNTAPDAAVQRLRDAGHPVVRLDLRGPYDLGAEFFRWEFATAVSGAIVGIQPFDQPNVQQAKDLTDAVLEAYRSRGALPAVEPGSSWQDLLTRLGDGDYLAIMAYVPEAPGVDQAVAALRSRIMQRHHVATTFGYGPRFLHSTGQLHKGGPGSGVFLQLVQDDGADVAITGRPYTFGTLAGAQALGDYQALQGLGRRVARVLLGTDVAGTIRQLADEV